ncbi:hypothetical protein OC834_004662 [Tilletia horrida]|uniref:Thiol methyltransferase 1 n=1 Tax=Tilletia horrida TaxID=155126 RepID=A0AAN6G812_9BASI|nr:hypothetical protein OC842_005286 [Tilletia horrida]KAK0526828.1 hypothetical protein OC834_004662 [Tilletia horrida]KAK0558420.1 hypothetical protein OC844_005167 [Tilletia horrida]
MAASAPAPAPPPQVQRVRALLSGDSTSGANPGWDSAWKESTTPWDGGEAQLALLSVLEDESIGGQFVPSEGTALVAGCGRGYEALVLAERGFETLGVDISEEAVAQAEKWLASQPDSLARERVDFMVQDFFALDFAMDLCFDHTFFCALPPSWRPRWAETYARIIMPGGVLIAVVYPIKGPNAGPDGPPFNVAPEHYKELLSADFELQWEGIPPKQKESRVGMEQVQIWKRKCP